MYSFSRNQFPKSYFPRNKRSLKSADFSRLNLNQDVSDIFEIFSACASKQLFGQLTNRVGNFKNLLVLDDLSNNSISSPIPFSIGELSSLTYLGLGENKLKGQLLQSFGQLANLRVFDIGNNMLKGVVSEILFANLTKLKYYASRNRLILKLRHDWIPYFQLEVRALRNWDVSSQFSLWLHSQKHLDYRGLLSYFSLMLSILLTAI